MCLYLCGFLGIFLHPFKQLHSQLLVGKLAATEAQGYFYLVTMINKLVHLFHLHIIIMLVDVWAHFDFFDFLRLLGFARSVSLFLRFKFIFAEIQKFADRGICVWRYLNQIKPGLCRLLYRFTGI